MYGIPLILVLVFMGGIIAYIGDRIGMSVGKKRLTVFGLRPRHTSILVTIITGILIATVSLATLTVASNDVRTALLGMRTLKAQLETLDQAVEDKDRSLTSLQRNYEDLIDEIDDKEEELDMLQAELEELIAQQVIYKEHIAEYQDELAENQEELALAEDSIADLQSTRDQLEEKIAGLIDQREDLRKHITELTRATEYYEESLIRIRTEDIIFQPQEELASTVINSRESDEITEQLKDLITAATHQALARGAAPSTEGGSVLQVRQFELTRLVELIAQLDTELVVRLVAASNTVQGEPVRTRFELHENRIIFKEGETIASAVIDGGRDTREIQSALLHELLLKVNQEAQERGMLPKSLGGEVGEISTQDFFDIVDAIDKEGKPVRVTALAAHEARTRPPLQIELKIDPAH